MSVWILLCSAVRLKLFGVIAAVHRVCPTDHFFPSPVVFVAPVFCSAREKSGSSDI